MKKIFLLIFYLGLLSLYIESCMKSDDSFKDTSTTGTSCSSNKNYSGGTSTDDEVEISSCASDTATVVFGRTYQYQLTLSGNYISATYSLDNNPDGMIITTTGLVNWIPSKGSDIKEHTVTIKVTSNSGKILYETYDLIVTGTCAAGNVLSIWTGDQRTSTDNSSLLGSVTGYTDSSSTPKTPFQNYNYYNSSVHLTHGPTPTATTGNVFFYNQYNDTSKTYLFWMFGVKGNSQANTVKLDVFTVGNTSTDALVESDEDAETTKESSGCGSSDACYKGRYSYNSSNSDGGVIGPFTGSFYRIFIDKGGTSTIDNSSTLTVGKLDSFKFYSKDGNAFALGDVDNFTVGYGATLDCSN